MTVQVRPRHEYTDIVATLEFRSRVRELEQLAAQEGFRLPMPAAWIATLEALGYVVDLQTGQWIDADNLAYMPTDAALLLNIDSAE